MTSEKAKARRLLVDVVNATVIPLIEARGFSELESLKEPVPMWHLHRARSDGGYDVISVIFDKGRRPLFDAVINVIGAEGVRQPWGEFVEASRASAVAPLSRIKIQKEKCGIAAILPRWLVRGWFGFSATESAEKNRVEAERACREFASCLEQAERWWTTKQLGPNLMCERIEMPRMRDSSSS